MKVGLNFICAIFFLVSAINDAHGQQHDCDSFTFSNCNVTNNDTLLWENPGPDDFENCQSVCAALPTCVFFSYDDGMCRLFRYYHVLSSSIIISFLWNCIHSEENRSTCELIGGSPIQEIRECLGEEASECDVFFQENCVFNGTDLGIPPPDGAVTNATDCHEWCKLFANCEYWTFEVESLSQKSK